MKNYYRNRTLLVVALVALTIKSVLSTEIVPAAAQDLTGPVFTARAIARLGDNLFVVTHPMFFFLEAGEIGIRVPEGFITDLASIPKGLHWWEGKVDRSLAPAILHDYLYWYQPCSKDEADALMLLGMQGMGSGRFTAAAIYAAVRTFGEEAYADNEKRRERGEIRTVTRNYLGGSLLGGRPVDPNETLESALEKAKAASGLLPAEVAEPTVKPICERALELVRRQGR